MPVFGQNLAFKKSKTLALVNETVGAKRLTYITDIPGQEMIYQAKEVEAKAYLALQAPPATLNDFPLMKKEVGITATTSQELAQIWLNMATIWRDAAADMEEARMRASYAIQTATTTAEVVTAWQNFESDMALI